MRTVDLYNEKGNVKAKARNELKATVMPEFIELLGGTVNEKGAILVPVAEDVSGETVYARFEMSISAPSHKVEAE